MRFLLINVPIRVDHPPSNFPTGLGIIAQVLLDSGHDVGILDVNAHRYSPEQVLSLAIETRADAIGISGLISTYKYQVWLIEELKKRLPNTPIIAGGGCATSIPELMMANTEVDYLVVGEGEHTIRELAGALESGDPLSDIKGLFYRQDGEVMVNEARPLEKDLDQFPMPAYGLFPVEIYLKYPIWNFQERAMNLISSRGCPMDCHFCYNLFGRRSYRKRGVDAIINEIRFLKREYGLKTFGFVDDNLTINKVHCKAVCDALAKEEITWGCHGRIDTSDDERLEVMAAAGCRWLGFGIESGSQRILDSMNKRVTVEKAKEAILRTRKHGIFANATFIFGYPGEDEESVKDTLRFKLEMGTLVDSFFATPYPGTELYAQSREKGMIPDEQAFIVSLNNAYDFRINLTEMPDDQLLDLKKLAHSELTTALMFKNVIIPKDKEEALLNLADQFLNSESLIPETKGEVLLGLSRHFESQGDSMMAFRTRSAALRYGVTWQPESEA